MFRIGKREAGRREEPRAKVVKVEGKGDVAQLAYAETQGLREAAQEMRAAEEMDARFPELWEQLSVGSSGGYAIRGDGAEGGGVRMQKFQALPAQVSERLNARKCFSAMGLFPEIGRAWVTVDNLLLVWNYEDAGEFVAYDGLDQVIVSVALVRPRADVYRRAEVAYLVVLATPVEVVLLEARFGEPDALGDLELAASPVAVGTDGVSMMRVVGTSTGRIFMGGKDGNLYELEYEAEATWLRRRVRLVNHTAGLFSALFPAIFAGADPDPLVDLALDETRDTLFTVSLAGVLRAYDIAVRAGELLEVGRIRDLCAAARKRGAKMDAVPADAPLVQSLHAVGRSESHRVQLVAVTSCGSRLYLTALPSVRTAMSAGSALASSRAAAAASEAVRPGCLDLVHVRQPPLMAQFKDVADPSRVAAMFSGATMLEVDTAFVGRGVSLLCNTATSEDTLLVVTPDAARARSKMDEAAMVVDGVEGKVYALDEVPLTVEMLRMPLPFPASAAGAAVGFSGLPWQTEARFCLRNELASQHIVPPRQFLCLSTSGLAVFERVRPVDVLVRLLEDARGYDSDELAAFFSDDVYGAAEASAMCLLVASLPRRFSMTVSLPNGRATQPLAVNAAAPRAPSEARLAEWALAAFFRYGVRPSLAAAHEGLSRFLSRLLRPVWDQTVRDILALRFDRLAEVRAALGGLREVLARQPHIAPMANDERKDSTTPVPSEPDRQALGHLHQLLRRSYEAVGLLTEASRYGIPAGDEALQSTVFSDLVTSADGHERSRRLVDGLVARVAERSSGEVEEVSRVLREQCPGLFREDDRTRLRGEELLRQARRAGGGGERRDLVARAVEHLRRVAAAVHNIEEVVGELTWQRAYAAAAELCLLRLEALGGESVQRAACVEQMLRVYGELFGVDVVPGDDGEEGRPAFGEGERQGEVEAAMRAGMSSRDGDAQGRLLAWMDQVGLRTELVTYAARYRSPFVGAFLEHDLELQASYHQVQGDFAKGAECLLRRAVSRGDITLEKRVELLARAVAFANTAAGDVPVAQELRERMGLAQVQLQIQHDLRGAARRRGQTKEAAALLDDQARLLDAQLLDSSTLFNKYAAPHRLWEAQLAIFAVAHYRDTRNYIERCWTELVNAEVRAGLRAVLDRVVLIGRRYHPSPVVPVPWLIRTLEALRTNESPAAIPQALLDVGETPTALLSAYVRQADATAADRDEQFKILEAAVACVSLTSDADSDHQFASSINSIISHLHSHTSLHAHRLLQHLNGRV